MEIPVESRNGDFMIRRRTFIHESILAFATGVIASKAEAQNVAPKGNKSTSPPISCIPILFFRDMIATRTMSVEDWIRMASRLGLDGIEVFDLFLTSWEAGYLSKLSDTIHKAGLAVSQFTTSNLDFSNSAPAIRTSTFSNVKRAVNAAVVFKTNTVRITAGKWIDGISRDNILNNIAQGIKECLDYAESRAVMLALEDHPEIGTKITDFMRILELVGDNRLKVNLDTSNPMVSGDNAVELVKLVKDRVVHVHASDRNKELVHTEVGAGAVDFPGIFRILKEAKFGGWISLEAGGTKGGGSIQRGMQYVKRTWASA
jgi:sugar phosphate isomerase/epimerase